MVDEHDSADNIGPLIEELFSDAEQKAGITPKGNHGQQDAASASAAPNLGGGGGAQMQSYFHKPLRLKSGRSPALYRAEVEAIRADTRTIAEIARAYGVSIMTIRRAKGTGRFAHEEYVPADEYERGHVRAPRAEGQFPVGRPLKRGRSLTDDEIRFILSNNWTLEEFAHHFRISVATVSRLKKKFRGWWPEGTSLEATIRADARPHHDIARQYDLPVEMIADIKNGLNIVSSGPNIPPPPPGSAPLVKPITPSDDET